MTWIKLNDNVPRHPKIAGLSDRAFRTWIDGLCYASEFLTDGVLPPSFVLLVSHRTLCELFNAGLWKCPEDGRVHIHDYLEHQSSKAGVARKRLLSQNRVAKHRGKAVENVDGNADGNAPVTDPEYREQRTDTDSPLNPPKGKRKNTLTRFVSLGGRRAN